MEKQDQLFGKLPAVSALQCGWMRVASFAGLCRCGPITRCACFCRGSGKIVPADMMRQCATALPRCCPLLPELARRALHLLHPAAAIWWVGFCGQLLGLPRPLIGLLAPPLHAWRPAGLNWWAACLRMQGSELLARESLQRAPADQDEWEFGDIWRGCQAGPHAAQAFTVPPTSAEVTVPAVHFRILLHR